MHIDRNNNFNFLRLLFATMVILSHSVEWKYGSKVYEPLYRTFGVMSFSDIAVDGFFLLSGFLILQSWDRKPEVLHYLIKRMRRIYPGYLAATAIAALIVVPLITDAEKYFSQFAIWPFVRSLALLQLPNVPNMFVGESFPYVNAPVWTISYEFRCYILVAVFGVAGLYRKRHLLLCLAAVSAVVMFIGLWLPSGVIDEMAFFGSDYLIGSVPSFSRLFAYFAVGGCFYLYRDYIHFQCRHALVFLPVLGICQFNAITAHLALLTIGSYMLFGFAFADISWLKKFKTGADISYGVYLYGWPVQRVCMFYFPEMSPMGLFFHTMAGIIPCGFLSWYLVERPFLKRAKASIRQPHESLPSPALLP